MTNFDAETVESFGAEWNRFDQSGLDDNEIQKIFDDYFRVVPKEIFNQETIVADIGCGSGRWARVLAPSVGKLVCFEPSNACAIAERNLSDLENVEVHKLRIDQLGAYTDYFDFAYSLGVVHHIPNTRQAIFDCVKIIKPGGYCLLYIYYALDNRPLWFRSVWHASNLIRKYISSRSDKSRDILCDLVAFGIYLPLKIFNTALKKAGFNAGNVPLSYYSDKSILTLRTDARDRFGTPLEKRFTRFQIKEMLEDAGLKQIKFSDFAPFWCVIGKK